MIFFSCNINRQECAGERGFTIIEAIVAFMVLTLALMPALILSSSSVNMALSIQNRLVAAGLAQEGIEVVRTIRDHNWFLMAPLPFDTGLAPGTYLVVWNSTSLTSFQDTFLYFHDNTGLYDYNALTAIETPFKRKITIAKLSDVELKVESEITWQERGRSRSVKVEEHLFDWK